MYCKGVQDQATYFGTLQWVGKSCRSGHLRDQKQNQVDNPPSLMTQAHLVFLWGMGCYCQVTHCTWPAKLERMSSGSVNGCNLPDIGTHRPL